MKTNKLSTWLWRQPLRFAYISCLCIFVIVLFSAMMGGIFGIKFNHTTNLLFVCLSWILSGIISLRHAPHDFLDRKSFVAITTAQTTILGITFIASILLLISNYSHLIIWFTMHSSIYVLLAFIFGLLLYMYLFGLFIYMIYAKYLRVRALNINPLRIFLSWPFGFPLLWIPAFVIPESGKQKPVIEMSDGRYKNLVNWIISSRAKTTFTLIILIGLSGFFFGVRSMLETFVLGLIFAFWLRAVGQTQFVKNIHLRYTTFAIIVNIALIVLFIGTIKLAHTPSPTTPQSPVEIMQITDR